MLKPRSDAAIVALFVIQTANVPPVSAQANAQTNTATTNHVVAINQR